LDDSDDVNRVASSVVVYAAQTLQLPGRKRGKTIVLGRLKSRGAIEHDLISMGGWIRQSPGRCHFSPCHEENTSLLNFGEPAIGVRLEKIAANLRGFVIFQEDVKMLPKTAVPVRVQHFGFADHLRVNRP
jgi:hypothetical protein